jgi:hypothetical protein
MCEMATAPLSAAIYAFPLLLAIVLAAIGFPLGLLFGWLIWG